MDNKKKKIGIRMLSQRMTLLVKITTKRKQIFDFFLDAKSTVHRTITYYY